MSDPRHKEWCRRYREKHREEILAKRRATYAEYEARRDPVKRKASRKACYERNKVRWYEAKKATRNRYKWSSIQEK